MTNIFCGLDDLIDLFQNDENVLKNNINDEDIDNIISKHNKKTLRGTLISDLDQEDSLYDKLYNTYDYITKYLKEGLNNVNNKIIDTYLNYNKKNNNYIIIGYDEKNLTNINCFSNLDDAFKDIKLKITDLETKSITKEKKLSREDIDMKINNLMKIRDNMIDDDIPREKIIELESEFITKYKNDYDVNFNTKLGEITQDELNEIDTRRGNDIKIDLTDKGTLEKIKNKFLKKEYIVADDPKNFNEKLENKINERTNIKI